MFGRRIGLLTQNTFYLDQAEPVCFAENRPALWLLPCVGCQIRHARRYLIFGGFADLDLSCSLAESVLVFERADLARASFEKVETITDAHGFDRMQYLGFDLGIRLRVIFGDDDDQVNVWRASLLPADGPRQG